MAILSPTVGRLARLTTSTALVAAAVAAAPAATAAPVASVTQNGSTTSAPEGFAGPQQASIHPGIMTTTAGAGICTSNFVFTDADRNFYIGQAAHCSAGPDSEATDTNGCTTPALPLGTPVRLGASGVSGKLAYNSWVAMQRVDERRPNPCRFNDFALVRIPREAVRMVNPSIPAFGGPTGVDTDGTRAGDTVVSYGNSPLRQGITALSPKEGASLGDTGNGWSHGIYTVTPGVPGDSGSAVLNGDGEALGLLSTGSLAPVPFANGIADLHLALTYARKHSDIDGLRLVRGTERFTAAALPVAAR